MIDLLSDPESVPWQHIELQAAVFMIDLLSDPESVPWQHIELQAAVSQGPRL